MRAHPLPEARSYADLMLAELRKVAGGFGQGYLFSEPIPSAQVPDLLLRRPLRRVA